MDFETARNLGLIGTIIIIVSPALIVIPWVGLLLSFLLDLAGFILILVSLYFFSKIYAEPRIFRDALISIVVAVVGIIVVILLIILLAVAFARDVGSDFARVPAEAPPEAFITTILGAFLGAILVASAASAISAFFWYRALNTLSRASGEGLFRLAGLLYAIGILLIIIGVFTLIILIGLVFILLGGIAGFAGWIVLAIAFYNLKQPQQIPPQPAMPSVPA